MFNILAQDNKTLEFYFFKCKICRVLNKFNTVYGGGCTTTPGPKLFALDDAFPGRWVVRGRLLPHKSPDV